jgi:hypothetical protein
MLDYVACDPNIQVVNLFHLVDESALEGWQSGLYFVGYQAKQSASTVSQWISQTGGNCAGAQKSWTPTGGTTGGASDGPSGGSNAAAIDPAFQAKLDALLKKGVFEGMSSGMAGSFDGIAVREKLQQLLTQLFSPADPTGVQAAFGEPDSSDWSAAYIKAASSLVQSTVQANFLAAGQAMSDSLTKLLGTIGVQSNVSATLVQCTTTNCIASTLAKQAQAFTCFVPGLCARTTSSAFARPAGKLVAKGTVTVKQGKTAKVKLRSVKGAKRAYGSYVLVLRVAPKAGAKPAAVAVKFAIKHAKATKAKAKPAKAAKGKAKATPKAKAKKH